MSNRNWLQTLGFTVTHVPGISRSWYYEFPDGRFLLVTDIGGFDLPDPCGPFSSTCFSGRNEPLEFVPFLQNPKDLFRFIRRHQRLSKNPSHQLTNHSHG